MPWRILLSSDSFKFPHRADVSAAETRLRPEQPDDDEFLYLLYGTTRAAELALTAWSEAQKESFVLDQFRLQRLQYRRYYPEATFDIVVCGDEPVGRLYVHRSQNEIRLIEITLVPAFRNRGLGTKLVNELLGEARNSGKRFTLHVQMNNRALAWYERLGLRKVTEVGLYIEMEWP